MSATYISTMASLVALMLAVSLSGCGIGGEAGTVPVTGTVTLDGQPVDGAAVAFIGNGGARLATTQTDSAGKFTVRAAAGKNAVTIAKAAPEAAAAAPVGDGLMPSEAELARMPPPPKPAFPPKYADPNTSGLAFDVKDGMPSIDLAVTSN